MGPLHEVTGLKYRRKIASVFYSYMRVTYMKLQVKSREEKKASVFNSYLWDPYMKFQVQSIEEKQHQCLFAI